MQDIKIVMLEGVKLDQEFLDILKRADREEMCEYRNAIIDERKHRQSTWQKVRNDKFRGDRNDLLLSFLDLALAVLMIVGAIYSIRRSISYDGGSKIGLLVFVILFIFMAILDLGSAARYYLKYRGIEVEVVKPGTVIDEMVDDNTKYIQLRRDTDKVLDIKQQRLSSMLGF